jgi:hypothetical protein
LFLTSSGRFSVGVSGVLALAPVSLVAAESVSTLSDHELDVLASIAPLIFPHQKAPPTLFGRIVDSIATKVARSPQDLEMVRKGVSQLDQLAGLDPWSARSDDERIAMLKEIETSLFFAFLRNTAVEVVYRDTEIWNLIGYGGSSIEHGGYLYRGFNNIDWLP